MDAPGSAVPLECKVAALRQPQAYPVATGSVETIETHMSWVFLTDAHAWKLKKPVRYDHQDFRSPAARHFYCLEELRLNRRLAPSVYLDVVPLCADAHGRLRVGGEGEAVDWLVQMRRLPAADLLDAMIPRGAATPAHLQAVARRLVLFYAGQRPVPLDGRGYRALLLRHLADAERELCEPAWELPIARVHAICAQLRAFVHDAAPLLDARLALGHVVEGHGDLRPEHVYLGEPLAIIDALEFSSELRIVDSADELGFLALECERLGAPSLAQALLAAYREASGDAVPPLLVHFYQACRACVRARLAVAHLRDARHAGERKWRRRALVYLALAARHLRACSGVNPGRPAAAPSAIRLRGSGGSPARTAVRSRAP